MSITRNETVDFEDKVLVQTLVCIHGLGEGAYFFSGQA